MDSKLVFANIFRTIARILSIFVILLGVPFLFFVGLQLLSGESGNLAIIINLLLLVGMLAGLIIAWRREGLGVVITFFSLVGSLGLSEASLPGVQPGQGFLLFVGPINLLFALLMPGYHPEVSSSARLVPIISWMLLIVPVVLFFASWLLRKQSPEQNPP